MDGARLQQVPDFKCLGCVLDELGTDDVECRRKVVSKGKAADAIRFQVSARGMQFGCARVPCDSLLVPAGLCGSAAKIWKGLGFVWCR